MRKDVIRLIKTIEKQVISILLVKGYVTLTDPNGEYKFSNISITSDGKKKINAPSVTVDVGKVEEYRSLFPTGKKGPPKTVKDRLERYLGDNNCTMDEVISATEYYINNVSNLDYCISAHYFLYKTEKSGETVSRIDEYMEIENQETETIDWTNENVV